MTDKDNTTRQVRIADKATKVYTPPKATEPMTAALDAQGALEPGTEGYWQVWGARTQDIQPGDLVMIRYEDTGISEFEVAELAPRGDGDLRDTIRPRFRAATGELFHVGALQPVVVMRKGTHHTLAGSVQ